MTSTNDLPDWSTVTASPDVALTGSPMAYTGGTTSANFTIPTGVHLLSIVLPGYGFVTELDVTGVATATPYASESPVRQTYQHQYYVLIPEGADTEVTVRIVASQAGTAYVTGVTDTVAVAALPQNPAPWEAANMPPLTLSFANPGIAGVVPIILAPGAGKSIWLHSLTFLWDTTAATMGGQFADTAGTDLLATVAAAAGIPTHAEFHGAKLAVGEGLEFIQGGAAAAGATNCRGCVVYSVY